MESDSEVGIFDEAVGNSGGEVGNFDSRVGISDEAVGDSDGRVRDFGVGVGDFDEGVAAAQEAVEKENGIRFVFGKIGKPVAKVLSVG